MNTPKMDVVRFKEADVVVASGAAVPTSMTATGWGDGTNGNLNITYGNAVYGYSNRNDLVTALTNNGQTDTVHTTSGKNYRFNQLFSTEHNNDNDTRTLSGFDWDSANSRWNSRQ